MNVNLRRAVLDDEIVIDKNYRKSGYGKALIKEFENIVKKRSAKLVSLSTRGVPQFYEIDAVISYLKIE